MSVTIHTSGDAWPMAFYSVRPACHETRSSLAKLEPSFYNLGASANKLSRYMDFLF